jgi:hypothetical protein
VTGGGYVAVTVPDRENKGERIVVYGHHTARAGDTPRPLHAGAKLSAVRQRVAEVQAQQKQQSSNPSSGGGSGSARDLRDAGNLGQLKEPLDKAVNELRTGGKLRNFRPFDGGPETKFRDDAESEKNGDAGKFMNHVRERHLPQGSPTDAMVHPALETLFSSQGQLLKQKQAYTLLTGYRPNGENAGKSILTKSEGFGSSDKDAVAEALDSEIDRINAKAAPQNDRQRAALHLAAGVIGREKQLPAEVMKAIHDKIGSGKASQSTANPAAAAPAPKAEPEKPSFDPEKKIERPPHFNQSQLRDAAEDHAAKLTEDMRLPHGSEEVLVPAIEKFAWMVGNLHPGLSDKQSAGIAAATIRDMASGSRADGHAAMSSLRTGSMTAFMATLRRKADEAAAKLGKSADLGDLLDDLDALEKAFNPGELRVSAGDIGGGQFAAEAGGHAASAAHQGGGVLAHHVREAVLDTGERAAGRAARGTSPTSQPWYSPARVGAELGGNVGGEVAWRIARNFIPAPLRAAGSLAEAGVAGLARSAGKFAGREGIQGAAGIVGGLAGGALGEHAVGGGYKPPEYNDAGEPLAEAAGTLAGGATLGSDTAVKAVKVLTGAARARLIGQTVGGVVGDLAGGWAPRVATAAGCSRAARTTGSRATTKERSPGSRRNTRARRHERRDLHPAQLTHDRPATLRRRAWDQEPVSGPRGRGSEQVSPRRQKQAGQDDPGSPFELYAQGT